MKIVLIIFFLLNSAWAIQKDSFYRQRAIMLAQHEYEKSLDLMLLDPETCKVPLNREERIRVLKMNIEVLNKTGKLNHCSELRLIGSRKIVQDLEKQKIALNDANEKLTDDGGIETHDNVSVSEPIAEVLEPIDNAMPLPEETKELFGTKPSSLPILAGYVGVPYASTPEYDETFYYFSRARGVTTTSYYESRNLPPGLTFLTGGGGEYVDSGEIVGMPTKAGSFSPIIEVGWIGLYGVKNPVYKGPVQMKVYPTPKYTVFHPQHRSNSFHLSRFSDEAPLLKVTFTSSSNRHPEGAPINHFPGFVRTINSIKSGKRYFEIKILDPGPEGKENIVIGLATKLDLQRTRYRTDASQFISVAGNQYLHPTGSTNKTIKRTLRKGDVVMIAINADANKVWTGVNGIWRDSSHFGFKDPSGGTEGLDITSLTRGVKINEFWPEIHGLNGVSLVANFGDQLWDFQPPQGFEGIPYEAPVLPNTWDTNTASKYMGVGWDIKAPDLVSTATSQQAYVIGDKGDAILSLSPKSSGRWQFEISSKGFGEKTQFGLAPASFDTRSYKKIGSAGTHSIGVRRLDEQVSKTGKGVIEVDGVSHYIDSYDDDARFTFDCNFDSGTLMIYANGKEIFNTKLPSNSSGKWVVATSSASGKTLLYSTKSAMKYPVRGAKEWSLDIKNVARTDSSIGSPVEVQSCPETYFVRSGEPATSENMSLACAMPETRFGRQASCWKRIPTPCMKSGDKFYCSAMDDFTGSSSQEECNNTCTGVVSVYKTCTKDGWKTETVHGLK